MLQEQGPSGLTTRAVAARAGVQAPAIYRLFGDKDGLLEAVAEHVMATFVAVQAATTGDVDPLDDLRAGWTTQIDFGVANPALFALLSDPSRALHSPAADAGQHILEARVHRVAATGRLRVSERRAVDIIAVAGIGAVLRILSTPPRPARPRARHHRVRERPTSYPHRRKPAGAREQRSASDSRGAPRQRRPPGHAQRR